MTLTARRSLAFVVAAAICAGIYFAFGAAGFFYAVGFIVLALIVGAFEALIVKSVKPDGNANNDPVYRENLDRLIKLHQQSEDAQK